VSFTAIAQRLLRVRSRRGGGVASYFAGDVAAVESLAKDIMAVAGVTGRAGFLAAMEAAADVLASTGTVPTVGGGAVLFQTTFESLSPGQSPQGLGGNGFKFGGGNTGWVQAVNMTRPGGSTRAIEFDFSAPGNLPELDFDIGQNVQHIFFRWWAFYPTGWLRTGTLNNKFIRLGNTYPEQGSPIHFGASTAGSSTGDEKFFFEFGGPGFYDQPGNGRGVYDSFVTSAIRGQWAKVELEYKNPTTDPINDPSPNNAGQGLGDGIMRVWLNDVLIRGLTNTGQCPASAFMRGGYMMGAQNSPYPAGSKMYITDFAVSLTGRV
jgi:hypothetical protein